MLAKIPQPLKLLLSVIPFTEFLTDMWTFIRRPEIYNGIDEYVPLNKCLANIFKSISLTAALVTLASMLMADRIPLANLYVLFDRTEFVMTILLQMLILGVTITTIMTTITFYKEKKFFITFFYQVVQAYSVLNMLVVALLYFGINRLFLSIINKGFIILDIAVFTLSLLSLYMFYRLIINPIRQCLNKYYSNSTSWVMAFLICGISLAATQHTPSTFENHGLSIKGFCETYSSVYLSSPSPEYQPKENIVQQCMSFATRQTEPNKYIFKIQYLLSSP